MEVEGQKIINLRELPKKVVQARKEYKDLMVKLKEEGINYRWGIPVELSFIFQGSRRFIRNKDQKEEFLNKLQKGKGLSKSKHQEDKTK